MEEEVVGMSFHSLVNWSGHLTVTEEFGSDWLGAGKVS